MAKDTYYFSHDYNARNDPKIRKLISVHGMVGYGIFWSIVEDLYQNANALPLDCDLIAFDLRTDCETVKSIINNFDLFIIDDNEFGSSAVERRLIERDSKSGKARESAFKRWNKNKDNANALQSHSEPNAIKERKVKEKKENNIVTWRDSYEIYLREGTKAFHDFWEDKELIAEQQDLFETVDIYKTINVASKYWLSKEAWMKKKSSKTKEINWKSTIENAIKMPFNKVYKPR